MTAAMLVDALQARLPAPVIVALLVVAAASALSLYVSIRIARRMRAIGDADETRAHGTEQTRDLPSPPPRER